MQNNTVNLRNMHFNYSIIPMKSSIPSLFTRNLLTFQVQYGELLLCFSSTDQAYCLVRMMEQLELPAGSPILNSFECPLLSLSRVIETVSAKNIRQVISIIHECGTTCKFDTVMRSKNIEREQVDQQRLTFVHDYSNLMFCLNVYCMGL